MYPRVKINNKEIGLGMEYTPDIKVYNIISDLSKNVEINNNVDTSKLGKYDVNVKFKYLFITFKKNYIVEVVDKEKPVISLVGNEIGIACPGKDYVDEGATASDNYDGDITDNIKVELGDNKLVYSVSDSSGNTDKIERSMNIRMLKVLLLN